MFNGSSDIVQHAKASVHGTSVSCTFANAPAANDVLIIAESNYPNNTITAPSGLTPIDSKVGSESMYDYYLVVTSQNASTTWTFSTSATTYMAVECYEIKGADTTNPIDVHGVVSSTTQTQSTPSVTPSGSGELPIAFFGNGTRSSYSGLTTGWTADDSVTSSYYLFDAHGPVTTGTGAVSASIQLTGGSGDGDAAIVVLKPAQSSFRSCQVFPAGDVYNTDISQASPDPNSSSIIKSWVDAQPAPTPSPESKLVATGSVAWEANVADSSTPEYQLWNNSPPTPGPVHQNVSNFPFLSTYNWQNKDSQTVGDRHLIVVNTSTCVESETYAYATNPPWTPSGTKLLQNSPYGSQWNLSQPMPSAKPGGVDAADLPYWAGWVRWEDWLSGSINHELNMDLRAHTINNTCAVWPSYVANSCSKTSTYYTGPANEEQYAIPLGAHLRLKSSFSLSCGANCPQAQMVVTALKTYGAYVMDTGGYAGYVYMASTTDSNGNWIFPWNASDIASLDSIPISAFEVVPPPGCSSIVTCEK